MVRAREFALLLLAATSLLPERADAADSATRTSADSPGGGAVEQGAYCRKIHARAEGDAALLFAPSLLVQGLKFPANGTTDTGVTTGSGYQLRAGLSYSFVDLYKGFRLLRAADLDCRQHDTVDRAQHVLNEVDDAGKLGSYRRQGAFLDEQKAAWERIAADADQRLARQVTPLLDTQEIRIRIGELERKRIAAHREAARIEARGALPEHLSPSTLASELEGRVMDWEREVSHLRTLDAWSLTFQGGVIPQGGAGDYFGILQLGFNLGGLWRYGRESRYLQARADELRDARYEIRDQLRRFQSQVAVAEREARRELAVVEAQRGSLRTIERALDRADAPNAAHALAIIRLDAISVDADALFLTTLIDELSRLEERREGP